MKLTGGLVGGRVISVVVLSIDSAEVVSVDSVVVGSVGGEGLQVVGLGGINGEVAVWTSFETVDTPNSVSVVSISLVCVTVVPSGHIVVEKLQQSSSELLESEFLYKC